MLFANVQRAEQEARQARDELRQEFDLMPVQVWRTDGNGVFEAANKQWYEFTGFTREQASAYVDTCHPEDREKVFGLFSRLRETGESGEVECRMRRCDGEYRRVLARAAPLRDETGLVIRWHGTTVDVEDLKRAEQQVLIERLDERERIARELHDTLLQGTQALILKVHAAAMLVDKGEPIHQALNNALNQATNALVDARNRIEDLRDPGAGDDLSTHLVRFAEDLTTSGVPSFKAVIEGRPRVLASDAQREIGLIGQEALLNAFHHAKACTIELELAFFDEFLQLRIRDDGIGFDETFPVPRGRHWGLPGMQERARKLSGAVKIWSRPGAGTEIELRVPHKVAYADSVLWDPASRIHGAFGHGF